MDVYPDEGKLSVLEVNTAFVDGWGTALNLSRAAGEGQKTAGLFPDKFATVERQYKPELDLLIGELALQDQVAVEVSNAKVVTDDVYVYGRLNNPPDNVLPKKGKELDNKQRLSEFSGIWQGDLVTTPGSYSIEQGVAWEDVPEDVYIKFVDKSSVESEKARFSVKPGKPSGKAPFLRRAYNNGLLIAQDRVPEYWCDIDGKTKAAQLVVLNKGDFLTGYVQYGNGYIINDNSIHAPLIFASSEEAA